MNPLARKRDRRQDGGFPTDPVGNTSDNPLPGMNLSQLPSDDANSRPFDVRLGECPLVCDPAPSREYADRGQLAVWSLQALTQDRSSCCPCPPIDHGNHFHGLIGQAINQYGWNALLIDSTGEVLWTSVKGLKWIVFSTDPARQKRWRRMVDRWWRDALDRQPSQTQCVGCVWGRKRLWLTQWSASQADRLLIAALRPSQLRGLIHSRWLQLLAGAAS